MSKALSFAIGAVAVVAAASTGVAWYTGTQIEPVLRQQVVEANQQLKTSLTGYPATAELELTSFERRLFSSTAHYVTTLQSPELNGGQAVQVEALANIEHGPFPWSRLKQLKLLPVIAASDIAVASSPQLVQWLGMPAGQSPMEIRSSASYGGGLDSQLRVLPGLWHGEQGALQFSGLEGTIKGTQDGKRMELDAQVGSIEYTAIDTPAPLTMQVQGLSIHTGGVKGTSGFYLGNNQLQAESWRFAGSGRQTFELHKPAMLGNLEELEGKLKGSVDYRFEQASIGDKAIGSAQMRWYFDSLDIAATRDLMTFYQKVMAPQAQAAAQAQAPLEPQLTPDQQAEVQVLLGRLLDGHPHIELQPLGFKTTNGESHLSVALDLAKPADTAMAPAQLASQILTRLDAKLVLAKGTIRDLATLKAQLEGQTDVAALAQNANGAADMVATLATLQGLAKLEGEDISTSLRYEGGMVDFNGQKMTVEQFAAFVMSALGQG
ncbi:YdgA family protein [Pseudomonas sp. RIT-PI-S]|uniref:YdgA family protein n=1 Tax=Pseudomonas sp. RIT-PI-S TaxID=3035295 RepID=UPI0021DA6C0C|nr:YdgA family protein [Pseudomonas sp. RIT-PI-S]